MHGVVLESRQKAGSRRRGDGERLAISLNILNRLQALNQINNTVSLKIPINVCMRVYIDTHTYIYIYLVAILCITL